MGIISGFLNLLFPPKCVFCRKLLHSGLSGCCEDCMKAAEGKDRLRKGTFFSTCVVSLPYEGQVKDAIHRFKFQDQPGYATTFSKIMGRSIRENLAGTYDLISWVPVSRKRKKERGYDQSMLLSLAVALELSDVAVETLRKTVNNPAQSGLEDAKARKQNVKDAYEAVDPELISGKRILLIDDVITTGATMEECARTLLRAGASSVVCAALARPQKTKESNS